MKNKEKIHSTVASELHFHKLVLLFYVKNWNHATGTSGFYARQASSKTNTGRLKFSTNLALRIFTKEGILKTFRYNCIILSYKCGVTHNCDESVFS